MAEERVTARYGARALIVWFACAALAAACGSGSSNPGESGDDIASPDNGAPGFDDTDVPGAPVVTILTPSANEVLGHGDPVTLTGHVQDAETPATQLTLVWSSDVDGPLVTTVANSSGLATTDVGGLSPGAHVLTLEATDHDGLTGSDTVPVLVNAAPTAPVVIIEPDEPTASDDLVAVIQVPSADANRAASALTVWHRWWVDGADSGLGGATVPAALTERGQIWQVQVWASDGHTDGPVGSDEVVIANSPPACEAAAILPSAGTTVDIFECTCTDREDADGDPADGDSCVFTLDDAPVQAGPCTLPPGVAKKGQTLGCTYTPHDGEDAGEPAEAPGVPILNAPPTAPVVSIDPPTGGLGTSFTCDVVTAGVDPDDDALVWKYTWLVNGYANPGQTTQVILPGQLVSGLDGAAPVKGDLLKCRVTASDGVATSIPADSPTVVLGNSPPTGGTVLISPAIATEATVLSCDAEDAEDPDEDPVSWLYGWHVNGDTLSGQASQTLTGAWFDKGDLVGCVATPTDGLANGLPVQAKNPVTIQNTLPLLDEVIATPDVTDQLGTFTCLWSGWNDPDPADPPQVGLQWQLQAEDGAWGDLEDETEATLAAGGFPKGTKLRCVATPRNGSLPGVAATSNVVQVGNTLPTVGQAEIVPPEGGPCVERTCEASGVSDPDPDETVLVAYRWTVNDQPTGAPKPTLTGVLLAPGDVLRCYARATDGSVDDDQETLYGAEVASDPVTVGNAIPTVESVLLTPPVASPNDTLTCTPQGVADADTCQEEGLELLYKWFADGSLVEGEEAPTMAAAALSVGTEVVCQVVVGDGWDFGDPVLSNPAVIGAAEPVVAIHAPDGAAGAVTCDLVQPATHALPLDYVWIWTFNGGAEQELAQTLPAGWVTDCDVVTCRAVASAADGYSVGSNTASESFPVGPGCDDLDQCTAEGCLPTGGCQSTPFDGPCDDGNPCTELEYCVEGFCLGGVEVTCDDGNPCTVDSCAAQTGCVAVPGPADPCGPSDIGTCVSGECCIPECAGKACGDDGCGGTCGECPEPEVCDPETGQCIGPSPGMTIVPAGGFWMGCNDKDDKDCTLDEYPFHAVWVSAFEMDLVHVTAAEYEICVDTFDCFPAGSGPGCNYQVQSKTNHPINCVNWYDADGYCAWVGKRLCTEAEWERAARGEDGRKYPWGYEDPTCDWAIMPDTQGVDGCGTGGTWPVGSLPEGQSPFGVLDMSGLVYDWVADWYWEVYYDAAPQTDPPGPTFGSFKVRRGGAYDSVIKDLRVSARHASAPNYGPPQFGFRCCKDFP